MKIGVITTRDRNGQVFEDRDFVDSKLTEVIKGFDPELGKNVTFISGGGRGAETFAIEYAEANGFTFEKIVPQIKSLGSEKAFIARNRAIIDTCEILVVFWAGENPYIISALNDAAFNRKPVVVYPIP